MRLIASNLSSSDRIAHGFFTREGGVSEGIYASLNCGSGSDDKPDHVKENQRRAIVELAGKEVPFCKCWQIHSADVITVNEPWSYDNLPKADAMVTNKPEIVLGILTADCVPILFADATTGVIGAAHSGWKGTIQDIGEKTIKTMEALGATRENIAAAIGPAIAQASYEVGDEFYQRFADESALYASFFKPSDKEAHYRFDITGLVKHRLAQSGLKSVEHLAIDTYSDEQRFFSYRRTTHRNEPDYGRQLSAIMMKE